MFRNLLSAVCLATLALGGCAVQLASAYDPSIDAEAESLEKDVLAFLAERQGNSQMPDGAYANYIKDYTGFSARLAVMQLRAAGDPGGVSCGEAVTLAGQLGRGAAMQTVLQGAAIPTDSAQSCIQLEVALLQRQFVLLQRNDRDECSTPGRACAFLFPAGTLADLLPGTPGPAVLARALVVSLDTVVGFEHDLRPATKG